MSGTIPSLCANISSGTGVVFWWKDTWSMAGCELCAGDGVGFVPGEDSS
jgi:hypothetical protein